MDFQEVASHFGITAPILSAEEIHSGNINRTYLVTVQGEDEEEKQYIFQRINTFVFKQPKTVMDNIIRVTEHIKKKLVEENGCYSRRVLSFLTADGGKPYYYSSRHHFVRVYEFVANASAPNKARTPEMFFEAGRGFGEFQGLLSDFPADTLAEIIPDFHNTPVRFQALREAVEENIAGRCADVRDEIRFVMDRQDECDVIVKALCEGRIPYRVTHNDTKINNILFDDETGKALCVIDLDTVMPGASLYDFGDAIRYGASTALEDERDLSKVSLDLEMYRQFTRGFITGTQGLLCEEEFRLLPYGAYILTLELIIRFLTDYLNGDVYFKINAPDHNLVRVRNQMQLLKDMEAKWSQMCDIAEQSRREVLG